MAETIQVPEMVRCRSRRRKVLVLMSAAVTSMFVVTSTASAQAAGSDRGPDVPVVLTSDLVKKFFVTQVELAKAAAPSVPPPNPTVFQPNESAQFLNSDPAAKRVFSQMGWTAFDFVRTWETILETAYALDMLEHGLITKLPENVSEPNVTVLQNLTSDVGAVYKTWKENALEPVLRVLREIRRQAPQKP